MKIRTKISNEILKYNLLYFCLDFLYSKQVREKNIMHLRENCKHFFSYFLVHKNHLNIIKVIRTSISLYLNLNKLIIITHVYALIKVIINI